MKIKDHYVEGFVRLPASRNTDPPTSHKAERKHTELGKRAVRARQMLKVVCKYPGHTSGELGRRFYEQYPKLPVLTAASTPHKRLPELEKFGLVERGNERPCTDSGYDAVTWHATAKGLKELRGMLS